MFRSLDHIIFCNNYNLFKLLEARLARPSCWPGCGLDGSGFEPRQMQDIFLFSKATRPCCRTNPASYSWGTWSFRSGRGIDHLPLSIVTVTNEWSQFSTPPMCLPDTDRSYFNLCIYLCKKTGFSAGHPPSLSTINSYSTKPSSRPYGPMASNYGAVHPSPT